MRGIIKKSLYDYAVEHNYITKDKAKTAKKYADTNTCSVNKALLDTGALDERTLVEILSNAYNCQAVYSLKSFKLDNALVSLFDRTRLQRLKMLPFANKPTMKVLVANPASTLQIEDYIRDVIPGTDKITFYVTSESELNSRIAGSIDVDGIDGSGIDFNNVAYDITDTQTSDVVSLANLICLEAVRLKASDIHIQPWENEVVIRFRVDGIMTEWRRMKRTVRSALTNRFKTMAGMNINNTLVPQNGRIRLQHGSGIDIRVSSMPTIYGEKLVLRLLNNTTQIISIDTIDLTDTIKDELLKLIKRTSGIILITGPTGSGKSTTSYACLSLLNNSSVCVVSLEDPVERKIEGIVQCEINQAIDLSFLSLLEETLRQDPDVILIGEIREKEVAQIAAQASNTGHLVFSTLHTNTAASAITRLIDMGVEPYMVSSTLNAVLNQRLVRKLCEHCKQEYQSVDDFPFREVVGDANLYKSVGCARCGGTGYSGRLAVHELLAVDDDIRIAIKKGVTAKEIEGIALKNGMRTILEDAIRKAACGLTSIDEVLRVVPFV